MSSRVEREHVDLRALLDQLADAHLGEALDQGVARLRGLLPAHLAAEERPGGFLSEARKRAPERSADIDRLQIEHREILEALEGLDTDPERKERIDALCAVLRDHERRESELIAEIAYTEAGTVD
ncbi:MAG: hemerythrin domain-containing protein [Alphaproteobacteria bacterium]|nr:hemerythrin domain-containing protein [Alphaproteobacteria bacterium]